MTSTVQSDTPFLDNFIQASAGYLIPVACLAANLGAYLNKDETKSYDILGLNVLANLFLLYAYLRGDRAASHGRRSDAQRDAVVKHASNVKTCSTFTGYAGPNREIFYRYRSTGRYCDTTAEQETIAGAIEHHIKKHGSKVCGTECLDLSHGGTWNGYLAIGPAKSFDHKAYCEPELSFGSCEQRRLSLSSP
ncbi:hypothetical protein FLAG1_09971 [Fusarium langsethiae]|uniref:Secreted protein CSS2 C-terminal domain-containing protein n=1 Tax=Fusarium langsethiae TaxID=179993 RepID=A0A0M9EPZ4_FUSLA|nr:hypothetical protein FLAG1_09971 [Fusarium langsethiae]GKU08152.1 unnamed protein product [Fusarium langsethiae]GKU22170.1 unnamed protein product [Fusarium langsethiae]